MAIQLIVVCDVRLYREGLYQVLRHRPGIDVLGTAAGAGEALRQVRELRPDLVLLDAGMPGALDLMEEVAREPVPARVVAIGVTEEPAAVLRCVEAGAAAYVPRDASIDDLVRAVEAAARGEVMCSPRIAATLMERVAHLAGRSRDLGSPAAATACLTDREREILDLIERGFSNKQIALHLGLRLATVKNHVHRILKKLGVSRRGAAAALARRM